MIFTGTVSGLIIASALFIGTHMIMSATKFRTASIHKIGVWPFRLIYSLVSGVLFTWMIAAYIHAPYTVIFEPATGLKHLSYSLMAISCLLLVCGYTQPNATAVGMENRGLAAGASGVLKVTRHPVMWGIAFWAICHFVANGHLAAMIFFGSMGFLAIAGAWHIDRKKRQLADPEWDAYMALTSNVPMLAIIKGKTRVERGEYKWWQILLSAALYIGLFVFHEPMFGPYVMPF